MDAARDRARPLHDLSRRVDRERRPPGQIGSVALGTGILAVSRADVLPVTLIGIAFVGISGGLGVASATSVAMGHIAPDRSGMASVILSVQRGLGSTAGFAIMGSAS